MDENAGVFRTAEGLTAETKIVDRLRERFKKVRVEDQSKVFNTELTATLELDYMLELAEVILDEAVLRRPVGGPGVMREQLACLTEVARRPNIAIQVIPFGAGAHEGLRGGAFVVADFDSAATIAYQDAASSGQIIEDAADVEALAVTWDTLRLDALPRAASVSLITSVAEAE